MSGPTFSGTRSKSHERVHANERKKAEYYSPITFDERVTFGFNAFGHCLVRVRLLLHFRVRLAHNYYAITRAYNALNAHTQGSDQAR